jgi:hypothetical protein
MGINGLPTTTIDLPFFKGIDTKVHPHHLEPPGLLTAENVEFDEVGGVRLRKPYSSLGLSVYPSGTISGSDVRKVVTVGDELLLFTKDTLYSWSSALSKWVSKGTHLAVSSTEATMFGNPSDQIFADRAQLSNVIVYTWAETLSGSTDVYVATVDATTGAVIMRPTKHGTSGGRPRLMAADTVVFFLDVIPGTGLFVLTISPAAPDTLGAASVLTVSEEGYDVARDPSGDAIVVVSRATLGTSYTVHKVTSAGVVTSSTKARTCDGAVALACAPGATDRVQIIREDVGASDVLGDLLVLSTLADVHTAQAIGATNGAGTLDQVTCAYRSVTNGGFYRCYVFWSLDEGTDDGSTSSVQSNWVDTNNSLGTAGTFVVAHGIASHAFDYNGSVFVWLVFASANNTSGTAIGFEIAAQNSYFLVRDDGEYFAKAAWLTAGGFGAYTGHLPGVALVSGTTGYAWCGLERGFVDTGGATFGYMGEGSYEYSDRAPRDILFTFDSDAARRVVQLGKTAYVTGSLVQQYDGEGLTEVGFEVFPWLISLTDNAAGGMAAGTYAYKLSYRWANARSETERSTTAIGQSIVVGASRETLWNASRLRLTKKKGSRRSPAIEMWRTVVDAANSEPFYLVTSRDPAVTGDNGYVSSSTTATASLAQTDTIADSALTDNETHPENDAVLPSIAPPPATIPLVTESRLFLAGIAGEPYRVWYSRLRGEGEIAAFNSALSFTIPADTGPITGLARWQEVLLVFTASAVYAVPGDGYDNTGGGTNYGPPRVLATDIGALSHDTIVVTPSGLVFFSRKGWYRLNGFAPEYIGAPVEEYNTNTWVAAQVVESQHQVRLLSSGSSGRMLMWDYLVGQWAVWTQTNGRDLTMWRATPVLLDTAVKTEQSTFTAVDYTMKVRTGWIKPAGLQGYARVKRFAVLGEYKEAHRQGVSVYYDYEGSRTDQRNMTYTAGPTTQLRQGPSRPRCEAMSIEVAIQAAATSGGTVPNGGIVGGVPAYDAVTLTGISLEVAVRPGLHRRLPATQKQ